MRHGYEVFHRDPQVPAEFYVSALGFERRGTGDGDFVAVMRDDLQVGCARHPDIPTTPTTPRRPPFGSEVVLRVDDVHAERERVRAAGWPVDAELQERPWGMTDFRLFDPTGQYIRVTGPATGPAQVLSA